MSNLSLNNAVTFVQLHFEQKLSEFHWGMAKRKGINQFGWPWLGSHFFLVSFHRVGVAFRGRNCFIVPSLSIWEIRVSYYRNRSLRHNWSAHMDWEETPPCCDVESMSEMSTFSSPLSSLPLLVGRFSGFVVCLAWFSVVVLFCPEIVLY